jgi:hypothetical protein
MTPDIRPQFTPLPCPTVDEIAKGLAAWQMSRPQALRVESAGSTPEGHDIPLCRITDFTVDDADKQVVLLTTAHVAMERNAATSLLHLTRWLISDDAQAAEIRRRQIVLIMPCNDPEGYRLGRKVRDVYSASWGWDGVQDPLACPEAAVLQAVIDHWQPEVYVDLHGLSLTEQTMWESTGISWSGAYSRSFIPEVPQRMNQAAEDAGFLMTTGEMSDGKLLASSPVPGADTHFYLRCGKVNPCAYAYHRYHAIAMTMEVGFEQSAIIRLQSLLQIGNAAWRGERHDGYPVHQIGNWMSVAIAAWGTTAVARRASRVELWQKLGQLLYSCAHPEPRGSMIACFSADPGLWQRLIPNGGAPLESVFASLRALPWYDVTALTSFLQQTPAQRLVGMHHSVPIAPGPSSTIENGVIIRLLIPDADARLTDIRLDGYPLVASDTDGYHAQRGPGTIVEVAIPPGKVRPFHIITCLYDTPNARPAGFHPIDWRL